MSGKEPLKLFRDKSNTFNLEDGLKIDAGSIGPPKLFILKFLKNNLHFQYTMKSNDQQNSKEGTNLKTSKKHIFSIGQFSQNQRMHLTKSIFQIKT
jgi:hypothetical protein